MIGDDIIPVPILRPIELTFKDNIENDKERWVFVYIYIYTNLEF